MRKISMLTGLMTSFLAAPAIAQDLEVVGRPHMGGVGFQPAATELARDLQWLDGMLLIIITAITLFVVALLVFAFIRFNRRSNPTPASFTHNTPIEVAWTIAPIIILVVIGAFSLPVLFKQQEIPEGDIVIKVTGYQWYWGYEYIGTDLAYESYMIGQPATLEAEDEEAGARAYVLDSAMEAKLVKAGYAKEDWLLATDTSVVVPVGATVVMQVTGADVIHSWTIPAFGVKQDAVPGRIAELWFAAEREGVYFGQCSELCGISHAYMPITVKVVSQEAYDAWLAASEEEGGYVDVRQFLANS
ncbi:cytochrome c oxidase subunit II [Salipiger sp. P9]|uniref:cytochrome c oxidase subunit II n=1 Tax=Salipiger pentaromativorans TaxID=2943193 RepID=UPI002157546E|nr:cytochrome c oxidase subunit II [Salipiger pentaromativorans]MCR8547649.1 cytochrome c oxidase subunit II [Salipiger pentaromativorans]